MFIDLRKLKFMKSLKSLNNSPAKLFLNWFGFREFRSVANLYDISDSDSEHVFQGKIWISLEHQLFGSSV